MGAARINICLQGDGPKNTPGTESTEAWGGNRRFLDRDSPPHKYSILHLPSTSASLMSFYVFKPHPPHSRMLRF